VLVLGPMLRHVTSTTATVWFETAAPARVEVLGRSARTFTVGGHHYALVILRDLPPGETIPYEVHVDGQRCWPAADSPFPTSVIRTTVEHHPVRVLFGSCRAAAPHELPYVAERDADPEARGVDALWAHARRMLGQDPHEWPDVAVFLGDQIYADDSSPRAAERIEARRAAHPDGNHPPDEVVADFEEYTWLYREAWSGDLERWFFSVVPSAMIFDDHDMIDDWNISDRWVEEIRREPWWQEHIIGGLVSYWIHQHLGNLSPDEIDEDGLLAELVALDDGTERLRQWAFASEEFTPVPGGYRFSHSRDVGGVRLVVVDSRNGRVLDPAARRMVDRDEWAWVTERALRPCDHLLVASSLPVFVPPGVHGLQQWNEVLCAGAWGRRVAHRSERLRRELDLEDWSGFAISFDEMVELLHTAARHPRDGAPPATVTVLAGDIHFAYTARVDLGDGVVVQQLVSSPMRNALATVERGAIRFVSSRVGSALGRVLGRLARRGHPRHRFELQDGPFFNNNIGLLELRSADEGRVVIERARLVDEEPQLEVVIDRPLERTGR
jgi:hypothetical protein